MTEIEIRVIKLISEGLQLKEVADVLGTQMRNIETHRDKLKKKLKAKSWSEIVSISYQYGILKLDELRYSRADMDNAFDAGEAHGYEIGAEAISNHLPKDAWLNRYEPCKVIIKHEMEMS